MLLKKIEDLKEKSLGITTRKLRNVGIELYLLYIHQLTDKQSLAESIIKPILQYNKAEELNIDVILNSIIYIDDVSTDDKVENIHGYILEEKNKLVQLLVLWEL